MHTLSTLHHLPPFTFHLCLEGAAGGNEGALCVGRVFAVDLDAGSNGTVTYESSGGNEGGSPGNDFFSVDPVTGQVCSTFGAAEALPPSATESVIWVSQCGEAQLH